MTLSTPLARKKKASPRVFYGDHKKAVLTQPSDSDTDIVGARETSIDDDKAVEPSKKSGVKRK